MALGFLGFLTFSGGFAIAYFPNPAAILVGGSGSILWIVMLTLCLINWAAAKSVLRLDNEGFQIDGPFRRQRVNWSQISKISLGDQSTGTIRLHLFTELAVGSEQSAVRRGCGELEFGGGGTADGSTPLPSDRHPSSTPTAADWRERLPGGRKVLLRLDLIEDGQELGRRIRAKVGEQARDRAVHDQTYRVANLPILLLLFGGGGVLMVAGCIWMVATSPHNRGLSATIFAAMLALMRRRWRDN